MPVPALRSTIPGWDATDSGQQPLRIGVVEGEGIGREVVRASLHVLDAVRSAFGLAIELIEAGDIGAVGPHGFGLDDRARTFYDAAFAADAPVLTGPAGGRFVYELRAEYDLFVKLVPVRTRAAVADASIIRPERIADVDVLIVRDNVGGMYQGAFGRRDDGKTAFQEAVYDTCQVDRLLAVAGRAAAARSGRLAVVTKPGGIPAVSALWRERAEAMDRRGVAIEIIEVDNACFQLVADPHRFDVVATPNMIGDIVSDTAAIVLGSRGLSYSANFGTPGRAVYQTGHGAAHDLAGRDVANPSAQILTLAWLLRESLDLPHAAAALERALVSTLASGVRTADVAGPGSRVVGTAAFADAVAAGVGAAAAEVDEPTAVPVAP
jgi:3-isopropylmalate dehydrogenase